MKYSHNMPELDKWKLFLEDEQERYKKCEDEETKKLLLVRIGSYERLIKEIESGSSSSR